jgi:hypothetical protein
MSLFAIKKTRTTSHPTKGPRDRQGLEFSIPEMRPCALLGPHAGAGWTCTSGRLAADPKEYWNLEKRTAMMPAMSRVGND